MHIGTSLKYLNIKVICQSCHVLSSIIIILFAHLVANRLGHIIGNFGMHGNLYALSFTARAS